jgi:prevent-host-death family protein
MKVSSIAEAKNNLSHLIHELDAEEAIQLTRHGKPVAVMMSEAHYKKLSSPTSSLNTAILNWRDQQDELSTGFSEGTLESIRSEAKGRDFSWDE